MWTRQSSFDHETGREKKSSLRKWSPKGLRQTQTRFWARSLVKTETRRKETQRQNWWKRYRKGNGRCLIKTPISIFPRSDRHLAAKGKRGLIPTLWFKNSVGAGKCILFKRMTTNQRKKTLREWDNHHLQPTVARLCFRQETPRDVKAIAWF